MLATLLTLLIASASAAAAPQPRAFPYPYQIHDFANGLRLITVPTGFPNVVSVYIVVAAGSRNEVEPGKSGFAHLFEHMMFRGTEKYPPEKYEAVLKRAGAASNAYTTDDRTVYHTTFSKEDLETILEIEADRFRYLKYSENVFRTEALAVLGEYNKNSASPVHKLFEVLRDTAFDRHTYKHTTMGFLRDIQDMPNQYQYSLRFFDRWYRPEYTTIIVAGDIDHTHTRKLVEKYWADWPPGRYKADIPAEPPQKGPRSQRIDWPSPTLPWVVVAFKGAAYSDTRSDQVTLDILSFLGFSESSPLYKKLVLDDQTVDVLHVSNPDRLDPELFAAVARIKDPARIDAVRNDILATFESFRRTPVDPKRLDDVKKHLRYRFALTMDNTEAIADILAAYVGLRRTPETINRLYELYDKVTPEDIQQIARKYFTEDTRTIVTLIGGASK